MSDIVVVGLLSFAGTLVGTLSGIVASSKMIAYRVEQLEAKVNKHNNLIDRMYHCEESLKIHDEKISVANHRINDLERGA